MLAIVVKSTLTVDYGSSTKIIILIFYNYANLGDRIFESVNCISLLNIPGFAWIRA
jgi:hypothetical protein